MRDETPTVRERLNDIAVAHSEGGCHPSYCEMLEACEGLSDVALVARLWGQTRDQAIENIGVLEKADLVDEFRENALDDIADHMIENGIRETRAWLDDRIAEVRAGNDPFDPEGMSLHNLEVARDRLNERTA